jgi:hypothetical protein
MAIVTVTLRHAEQLCGGLGRNACAEAWRTSVTMTITRSGNSPLVRGRRWLPVTVQAIRHTKKPPGFDARRPESTKKSGQQKQLRALGR